MFIRENNYGCTKNATCDLEFFHWASGIEAGCSMVTTLEKHAQRFVARNILRTVQRGQGSLSQIPD